MPTAQGYAMTTIPTPEAFSKTARLTPAEHSQLKEQARLDPETYWAAQAENFSWFTKPTSVKNVNFDPANHEIEWFGGGETNLCVNAVDRHLSAHPDAPAIIWEGDDPNQSTTLSYRELHTRVCKAASVLRNLKVSKGDRVTLYMPMTPDAAVIMLACSRIGAVHSVVFAGFSAEALAGRILDSGSRVVITSDGSFRSGKAHALKTSVDAALDQVAEDDPSLSAQLQLVVFKNTGDHCSMKSGRDHWYPDLAEGTADNSEPEVMQSEDPLFLLYTSGSTGKPKGVVHSTAGYMVYAATTFNLVFDAKGAGSKDPDVFWCTADVGWITGHTYMVYGPLLAGVTTLLFEGVPSYPNFGRFGEVIDKHGVSLFYTAPTAIRALMRESAVALGSSSRDSLRLIGSVGEPINPEAWHWYFTQFGGARCHLVDTWWQTETGGILMTPLPGTAMKPGAAMQPLPGIEPVLINEAGLEIEGPGQGLLAIRSGWPGQMRGVWQNPKRFLETYYEPHPGYYFTGDGAMRDSDGDLWITGRVDDVLNVSGHRLGTAEIESALVAHKACAEAAVVGIPHDIKGEAIVAYVQLNPDFETIEAAELDGLRTSLIQEVRTRLSPIATPERLIFAQDLPKTRSGKIMRRILRKLATGEKQDFGDTSTLADPAVIELLLVAVSTQP